MKRSLPRQDFAPLSLLLKILELQAAYYATAAVAMLFTCALSGRALDLSLVVSAEPVRGDTAVGWTLGVVWVLVGWIMYIPSSSLPPSLPSPPYPPTPIMIGGLRWKATLEK